MRRAGPLRARAFPFFAFVLSRKDRLFTMPRVSFSVFFGAVAAVSFTALCARADLKIVTESISVKDGMTQKPTTQTLYIQDEMVRHDLGSGATLIHDLTSDTYFYLDNIHKRCATLSGKVQGVRESQWNTLVAENTNVLGTADVKPGGKTKIIAGKTAKNYLYTATMKAVVRGNARQFLTMQLRGEVWIAPDLVLSPRVRRLEDATFVRSLGPFARAAKPLLAKFGKIKGYPLSSRQTSTVVLSRGDQDATKQVLTETETATLISQDRLAPSLFIVPATYQEVSPSPDQLPDDVRVTIIN